MVKKERSLCFWKIFQTKLDAVNAANKLKINFEHTARFDLLPKVIDVLGQEVTVFVLVVTDYEASWMNTAGYCAMYRDIKAAKGVARDE